MKKNEETIKRTMVAEAEGDKGQKVSFRLPLRITVQRPALKCVPKKKKMSLGVGVRISKPSLGEVKA